MDVKFVVAGDFGTGSVPVLFVDPFSRKKVFIVQNVTMFPVSPTELKTNKTMTSATPSNAPCSTVSIGVVLLTTLLILGLASPHLRGDIIDIQPSSSAAADHLRNVVLDTNSDIINTIDTEEVATSPIPIYDTDDESKYYIFLQKFPLESTWRMIFHTEVIVCPRETFQDDADFLITLDELVNTLVPSRFVSEHASGDGLDSGATAAFTEVPKEQWSKQSTAGCVQLGYGGSSCPTPCCSVPHKSKNTAYPLNSQEAVISNAMGDHKELYLYGTTHIKDGGEAAFKAVCHGHYGAIEQGRLPTCVSNWAGTDYNPLTNNCNTFTSTVLKCVFGLSDSKPGLGVSDLITVSCPTEKGEDGSVDVQQCQIPSEFQNVGLEEVEGEELVVAIELE